MNHQFIVAALLAAWGVTGMAQTLPGLPEENGLSPKTATIYVNRLTSEITTINNFNTESLGVAIANGGNVIVGWEDDDDNAPSPRDFEAVWTLFDSAGVSIIPDTDVTCVAPDTQGTVNTRFLSYFRANGTAIGGGHSWGPKIQANPFGDGVGMGATTWQLDLEEPTLAAFDGNNQGDYPTVQLLSNTGTPIGIVPGVSSDFAIRLPDGIRIGDWGYLSSGNVVVVSENRQNQDLIDLFGGDAAFRNVVFRITQPNGTVVKTETLVSETGVQTANSEMWHGVGMTANGFAVRFLFQGRVIVRMFDNAGTATSTNIDLANVTGHPEAGGGGRGDNAGFHGNGKDAYVAACTSGASVWVTVLSTNGTVRWSKSVATDVTLTTAGAADAAIDPDGNVIVVFQGQLEGLNHLVMGRRFNAAGDPVGGTFHVSEKELPDAATQPAEGPRVAWRGGQVAIVWESLNDFETINPGTGVAGKVVAMRLFSTFTPGSIESVGLTRIVPDTPVVKTTENALGNWEPYISVLGTSTFLIEGNTFAEDGVNQRYVVALQPAAGGAMKLGEGFHADNGQPYKGQINLSRQNGNPGRVAGDARPGAVNFMVGGEASPHGFPEFQSDNRWTLGFDRLGDGRYGTIQIYSLDPATLTQTPLCKAQDSAHGRATSGTPAGNQISRYGGDMVCLDNGNFVSVVQDNSRVLAPESDAPVATIFAPNGSIVKEAWAIVNSDIWANVAAFKGGFAVRAKPADGSATRLIYFFDNAGTLLGTVDQAASGASFDAGRGDGTRIFGHINSPYVFLAGRAANTQIVKVAAFDSRNQTFVAIADVNEGAFTGNFDRATGAADARDRVTVSWVSQPTGYAQQQVAARVLAFDGAGKKFTPLTASFFPFVNVATNDIKTFQMSVAMTTRQICVAAKGQINYENQPQLGPNSPTEVNFYTVISHPNPQDDPTTPVGGAAPTISGQRNGASLTLSWPVSETGYTLQSSPTLTGPTWTAVGGVVNNSVTINMTGSSQFFRLTK